MRFICERCFVSLIISIVSLIISWISAECLRLNSSLYGANREMALSFFLMSLDRRVFSEGVNFTPWGWFFIMKSSCFLNRERTSGFSLRVFRRDILFLVGF